MRTCLPWLPWVGLALVAVLAIAYFVVVMVHGGLHYRQGEPFEASGSSASPACLTRPTLQRYENAATDLEQALKTVVRVYDDYAKDAAGPSDATGDDQPIPGEEMDDQPSIPGGEGKGMSGFGGAQMDGGSTAGFGGGLPASTTGTGTGASGMPSTPSFEGFANTKAACIRDPKALQKAQTQYKERPLALLKVYNALRTRVDKGIEGLARIRKMKGQAKAQEKQRVQQTKAIQQAGVAQEASLNDYYKQGGSASGFTSSSP